MFSFVYKFGVSGICALKSVCVCVCARAFVCGGGGVRWLVGWLVSSDTNYPPHQASSFYD